MAERMSIDLTICLENTIQANILTDLIKKTLHSLTNSVNIPDIYLKKMEAGEILAVKENDIIGRSDAMYILKYIDREESLAIIISLNDNSDNHYYATFSVGGICTAEEYILGLAAALALGKEYNQEIEDGALFWTDKEKHHSQQLFEQIKISNVYPDFFEACKKIVANRID